MSKKLFILLIGLAAFLRLWLIWRAPLWYDENFSLLLSRMPLARMLTATIGDVHPPLHYLTIWPIGQIGGSVWLIRLPSAFFSLLALLVFWRILQELSLSNRIKVAALILMSIAPIQLYYAQEGRMYALLELTVLLTFWAALSPRRRWLVLFLSAMAMLYTQNYSVFYLACILGYWLITNRQEWRYMISALGLAGLAWLPWSFIIIQQMHNIDGTYWIQSVTLGHALYIFVPMLFLPSFSPRFDLIFSVVYYGWLFYTLFFVLRHKSRELLGILLLAFGPWLMASMASWTWQPILLFRPLLASGPFLYIMLAYPVDWISQKPIRWIYSSIYILPLLIVQIFSFYNFEIASKNDVTVARTALAQIEQAWQPGDLVYHQSDGSWINMAPYTIHFDRHFKSPACGSVLGALSLLTRKALGEVVAPLEQLNYKRAWIITVQDASNPQCETDYLNTFIKDSPPVTCFQDDANIRACLYLINN